MISVVIPCYNEEASIGVVLKSLPSNLGEVIVVDNNCTDRTAEIATAAGARVVKEAVPGYGAALKAGFRAAREDIIVTLDGDGQYPAALIPELVRQLETSGLDFISASRFPLDDRQALTTMGIFGNRVLTVAANLIFGLRLADSQSGMWIFKRSVLNHITLESNDMPLSEELKIRVATHPALKFAERHIPYHPRLGTSKLVPLKHGIMNLWFLVRLRHSLGQSNQTK